MASIQSNPTVSVIVPVYGVEPYLRDCLDSIVNQSYSDIEIVAVNDASPDGCGAILDEYARRDSRLRVIHLDRNIGQGPARGTGFAASSGGYVWFVDSDDWLADGAIASIVDRLRSDPLDMLMIDAEATYQQGGRMVVDHVQHVRPPAPVPSVFTFLDWPDIFHFVTPWSRVIRRDVIVQAGSPFYPGLYEDLPFTFAILCQATRTAVLPRICYHYRLRRAGSITSSLDERCLAFVAQYAHVFDRLDELGLPADDPLRELATQWLVKHGWGLVSKTRIPVDLRRKLLTTLSTEYRRRRSHRSPTLLKERLRHVVIAHDLWRVHQAWQVGATAKRLARGVMP